MPLAVASVVLTAATRAMQVVSFVQAPDEACRVPHQVSRAPGTAQLADATCMALQAQQQATMNLLPDVPASAGKAGHWNATRGSACRGINACYINSLHFGCRREVARGIAMLSCRHYGQLELLPTPAPMFLGHLRGDLLHAVVHVLMHSTGSKLIDRHGRARGTKASPGSCPAWPIPVS